VVFALAFKVSGIKKIVVDQKIFSESLGPRGPDFHSGIEMIKAIEKTSESPVPC
jgi:hypothetical protein